MGETNSGTSQTGTPGDIITILGSYRYYQLWLDVLLRDYIQAGRTGYHSHEPCLDAWRGPKTIRASQVKRIRRSPWKKFGSTSSPPGLQTERIIKRLSLKDLEKLLCDTEFAWEQREDPTVSHAYEQLTSINDKVVEPLWVRQWSYLVLHNEHLYCVWGDKQHGKVRTQLLVPRLCHQAFLHVKDNVPHARH